MKKSFLLLHFALYSLAFNNSIFSSEEPVQKKHAQIMVRGTLRNVCPVHPYSPPTSKAVFLDAYFHATTSMTLAFCAMTLLTNPESEYRPESKPLAVLSAIGSTYTATEGIKEFMGNMQEIREAKQRELDKLK